MSHNLKRIFSLKFKTYLLLIEAWFTLAWVDLMIRFFSYERWRHWLDYDERSAKVLQQKEIDISSLINFSEMVARHHLCAMNCLRRTVAQKKILKRRGVLSRVHIGVKKIDVKKNSGGFEAHSWLSYNGKVLNDSPDVTERYFELEQNQWRNIKRFSGE